MHWHSLVARIPMNGDVWEFFNANESASSQFLWFQFGIKLSYFMCIFIHLYGFFLCVCLVVVFGQESLAAHTYIHTSRIVFHWRSYESAKQSHTRQPKNHLLYGYFAIHLLCECVSANACSQIVYVMLKFIIIRLSHILEQKQFAKYTLNFQI